MSVAANLPGAFKSCVEECYWFHRVVERIKNSDVFCTYIAVNWLASVFQLICTQPLVVLEKFSTLWYFLSTSIYLRYFIYLHLHFIYLIFRSWTYFKVNRTHCGSLFKLIRKQTLRNMNLTAVFVNGGIVYIGTQTASIVHDCRERKMRVH